MSDQVDVMPEMEYLNCCETCHSEELEVLAPERVRKFFVTDHAEMAIAYGVMACKRCGMVFLNPRMGGTTLKEYYSRQSRMPRQNMDHASPSYRFMCMQAELIGRHKKLKENDNVLEIGCAEGYFLRLLNEKHEGLLNVHGIEPSEKYADQAAENVQSIHLHRSTLAEAELSADFFDLIVIRHVLEHLPNPVDALKIMRNVLKHDGVVYIEVPDLATVSPTISDCYGPEHLSYFTEETLTASLARAGLSPVHIERFHGNPYGSGFSYPVLRAVVGRCADTVPIDMPNQYGVLWEKQTDATKAFCHEHLDGVMEILDQHKKEGSTMAIFGAGPHTMDLFERLEGKGYTWAMIFDNNSNKHGKAMMGIPIVKPEEEMLSQVDCILISTAEFEQEIFEQLGGFNLVNTEIIPIYQAQVHMVGQ